MKITYSGIVYCFIYDSAFAEKKKCSKTRIPYSQSSHPVLFIVCKILLSFSFVKDVTLGGKSDCSFK